MYKEIIVSFIKVIQKNGLKELSELIIKKTFCLMKKMTNEYPYLTFNNSFSKARVYFEVRSVKVAGINYKVPVEVRFKRQRSLVLKWFLLNAHKRKVCSLALATEIVNTYNLTSNTIKLCNDFHKIAELNRIYIQYRH